MEENTSTPQESGSNPMKMVIPVIVILVIAAAAFFLLKGKSAAPQSSTTTTQNTTQERSPTQAVQAAETSSPSGAMTAGKEEAVAIVGSNFSFDKNEITVKKGDKVTITFSNNEGFHDFVIDEYNVRTKRIAVGQSDSVTFVADKVGTFEYYCSVGNHRQMGMKGNLIVE